MGLSMHSILIKGTPMTNEEIGRAIVLEVALDPHDVWPPEACAMLGAAAMKVMARFNWMGLPPGDQTALFDRVARAIAELDAAAGYVLVPREELRSVQDMAKRFCGIGAKPTDADVDLNFRRLENMLVASQEPGNE